MIILDKPYVSNLLADTVRKLEVPVIKLNNVFVPEDQGVNYRGIEELLVDFNSGNKPILFNSENGLHILNQYFPTNYLTTVTEILKNKVMFRKILSNHYTDFFFKEVTLAELEELDPLTLPFPIIVKPAIGYSSIGVHRMDVREEYQRSIQQLKEEMIVAGREYPKGVINSQTFIIEELIEGDEYAIDAYFTEDGKPVILNLFKRMFSHSKDMSDRIYYTSKQVLTDSLEIITDFLDKLSTFFSIKLAPMHIEVRMNSAGQIIPIEVNPLRFAGIGTNELGVYAYGINAYEYFFKQQEPAWEQILKNMDDSIYSFCCAEIDSSIDCKMVKSVNHEAFKQNFEEILEYRPMPTGEYSTFAVVFHRSSNLEENMRILQIDLNEYVTMKTLINV